MHPQQTRQVWFSLYRRFYLCCVRLNLRFVIFMLIAIRFKNESQGSLSSRNPYGKWLISKINSNSLIKFNRQIIINWKRIDIKHSNNRQYLSVRHFDIYAIKSRLNEKYRFLVLFQLFTKYPTITRKSLDIELTIL